MARTHEQQPTGEVGDEREDVVARGRQLDDATIERMAAGRDRVIDLARAAAMVAVALGHWLVTDVRHAPDGGLVLADSLAALPALQLLTWVFQVMPVFFFAGGAVGFVSWHRHRRAGRPAGHWIAARLWRLAWPTMVVTVFWVVVTQFAARVVELDTDLLTATRSIALVVWFLAVYAIIVALIPVLDRLCDRLGLGAPVAMLTAAVVVDALVAWMGATPPWTMINYLFVWGAVTSLGRWWPARPTPAHRTVGLRIAAAGLGMLVVVVATGLYPLSMVGVAGAERTNSFPPTVAVALLGVCQVGLLVAARPALARWLTDPSRYRVVGMLGARAMTIYLWHALAPALLAVGLVLPDIWPTAAVGSVGWWLLRVAWAAASCLLTIPVVLLMGRFERAPDIDLSTSTPGAVIATVGFAVAWAAQALQGFYVPRWPGGWPVWTLGGLVIAVYALLRVRTPTQRQGRS